jgi:hypothetical protein
LTDRNDKYRERWNDRRKKAYNWKKVIILALALVGVFILLDRLDNIGPIVGKHAVEVIEPDSTSQVNTPADSTTGRVK